MLAESHYESLYSWAITEVDSEGKVIGRDQIPWVWTLYFTATEIALSDQLNVKEERPRDEHQLGQTAEILHRRVIRTKLRPGDTRSDENFYGRTTYRMFGTDRVVKEFALDIHPLPDESDKEEARVWGIVAYTDSNDFHPSKQDDYVGFSLMVKPTTFELYARRFAEGTADELILGVGLVSGFYSEWSPDVFTTDVKILTTGKEHVVEMPVGIEFEPPRLGSIGEANLYINAKRVQSKPKPNNGDDEDDRPAPVLTRPEIADKPAGWDPQTVALLQSLKASAKWITGLLIIIAIVLLVKR
ncbi:MAG: hypothetical protein K0S56_2660 [Microvirga sp.]|nr:hypothetical protein [Microvirga sp.]